MKYDINVIETEYPIIDNLVYNGKKLLLDCILKDEEEAGKYETLNTLRYADMYIECVKGTAIYSMFNYDKNQMLEVGIPSEDCDKYKYHYDIPNQYHSRLLKIAIRDYINAYEETNDYYRAFCGLPPMGQKGIKISENILDVDSSKYIHEMTKIEISVLESAGILEKYRKLYPNSEYLNFLGTNRIDPYFLRTLPKFGIIYLPQINIPEIRNRYKENLEKNRVYCITCLYNDAMKFGNDYYDKFIIMMIKIQALVDLFIDVPDMIIRKDLFDLRSIKYMFESNGIKYFEEIPLKYQLAMLKNLNTLLTFKSTTKNMIDICSIFGFKNIEIFKYYILKDRKTDANGDYLFDTTEELNPETGEYETVEDYVNNFELKFVKVPVEGILDNYIRDDKNYISYEDMTKDDPYWTGGQDPNDVYRSIVEREFDIERSKYVSIDTVYEMDRLSFEMAYFFNMIMDDVMLEENLTLKVSSISNNPIKIKHVIMYLYMLNYELCGVEDTIVSDSATKILTVNGFNFKIELSKISEYLNKHKVSLEDLGIQDFIIPDDQILTFNQLVNIYLKNKNVHDHMVRQMVNADSYDVYSAYKDMYDALMVTDISLKIFELPNGNTATTYTEYFSHYNIDIYENIQTIRSLSEKDKENFISDTMMTILCALEDNIDTTEFEFLFINIPMASEVVKGYIYNVIDFYKSRRIQLDKINTIYKFDDVLENRVNLNDCKRILASFNIDTEYIRPEVSIFNIFHKIRDAVTFEDSIILAWMLDHIDDEYLFGILNEEKYTVSELIDNDYAHFMFKHKIRLQTVIDIKDRMYHDDIIHISRVDEKTFN